MSKDNGVYILECKDQYRVNHIQAIERLYDDTDNESEVSYRCAVNMFGNCKGIENISEALNEAWNILTKLNVCEYGIQRIVCNKDWEEIKNSIQ